MIWDAIYVNVFDVFLPHSTKKSVTTFPKFDFNKQDKLQIGVMETAECVFATHSRSAAYKSLSCSSKQSHSRSSTDILLNQKKIENLQSARTRTQGQKGRLTQCQITLLERTEYHEDDECLRAEGKVSRIKYF